jgi:hypothetical protein
MALPVSACHEKFANAIALFGICIFCLAQNKRSQKGLDLFIWCTNKCATNPSELFHAFHWAVGIDPGRILIQPRNAASVYLLAELASIQHCVLENS